MRAWVPVVVALRSHRLHVHQVDLHHAAELPQKLFEQKVHLLNALGGAAVAPDDSVARTRTCMVVDSLLEVVDILEEVVGRKGRKQPGMCQRDLTPLRRNRSFQGVVGPHRPLKYPHSERRP
mmetsp:Transcript_70298/g.139324  ORF Transcript_70298/g.139324 Transcript_70298/m.139324 type:complete len:122 (+) Transcript_70298:614-979(+)